jgi:hypothetical protein
MTKKARERNLKNDFEEIGQKVERNLMSKAVKRKKNKLELMKLRIKRLPGYILEPSCFASRP